MTKSRTVWAVVIAAAFLAAGYFLGAPDLIDDPEFGNSVREFIRMAGEVAALAAILFARFKRS